MEWLLGVALALCLLKILSFRRRIRILLAHSESTEKRADQARAADNALVLAVLAREIANELMQCDEKKYLARFERLYDKWQEIKKKDNKAKLAHFETITSKYATFLDFDNLSTWPHVLYADGFNRQSDDDWWDLYESIRLYDALSCELDENWRSHGSSISEKEYKHLKEYCRKLSDTKLLAHLHKARDEYWNLRRNKVEPNEAENSEWQYETKDYSFKPVYHVAERRVGVYVKPLDRYGMWGVFDADDNIDYTSFYGSDKKFNESYFL